MIKNYNLLQTATSSSTSSGQSRWPSQTHVLGMHLPLVHLNSDSLHSRVSETFIWEWSMAPITKIVAHASCNRMHVHQNICRRSVLNSCRAAWSLVTYENCITDKIVRDALRVKVHNDTKFPMTRMT